MKKRLFLILLVGLTWIAQAKEPLKAYQAGDFSVLTKKYPNQPLIIHFWGTTCAPCITELPTWGKFLKREKNLNVIFVQVDNASEAMMRQRIQKAKLEKFEQYYLKSNFDEFIFFEVDRQWHGEIPMTLLINKDGSRKKILGAVDFNEIKKWSMNP